MDRIAAGLAVALIAAGLPADAARQEPLPAGTQAPEISGTTLDGRSLKLSALRGKKVVAVVFLSHLCALSTRALPDLQKLHAELSPQKGFTLVGVAVDDEAKAVKSYVAEHGVTFPVIRDGEYQVVKAYGPQVTPTVFLVGRSGKILRWYAGFTKQTVPALRADAKAAVAGRPPRSSKPVRGLGCVIAVD
ncbi:MAG: peroxiredoxin family protein [Armatimonadota bacterium]